MKRTVFYCLAILCITVLTGRDLLAQGIPSFPGAEGFGAVATGGRGGQVIYVTNLNCSGPGSLAEALATPGPRTVLFKVSGVIDCVAEVVYGDVTIAGQTSPCGVTVRGILIDEYYDTLGTGENIIIRHMRSRPGPEHVRPGDGWVLDDGIRLDGASKVIVDHCSFAWASDECVQVSRSSEVSIQFNQLAEPFTDHFVRGGMLLNYTEPDLPQQHISIHHNLWNRVGGRYPEIIGESPTAGQYPLDVEVSNNLYWDQQTTVWYRPFIDQDLTIDSFFVHANFIGNMAVARPAYCEAMFEHTYLEEEANQLFIDDNHMSLYPNYSDEQLFYCCNDFCTAPNNPNTDLGVAQLLGTRHNYPIITYQSAANLRTYLEPKVGAFPRDTMDRRLLKWVASNTIDQTPVDSGMYQYHSDAFLSTCAGSSHPDSDNDGMPDYWENLHGLNPQSADNNGTGLSSTLMGMAGYTNLECYLHCLSEYLISGNNAGTCGIVLANDKPQFAFEFELYPNPATDLVKIELPKTLRGTIQLTLTDAQGKLIQAWEGPSNKTYEIDIHDYVSGIYLLQIVNQQGEMASRKIIKH